MTRRSEVSVESATKLNSSLQLQDVGLLEVVARVLNQPEAQDPVWCFSMKLGAVHWEREEDAVVAMYRLTVLMQTKVTDARENIAVVRVAIRATYRVIELIDETREECIPDFLGIVGWMHVWPYFRAEVQQLSAKLGYPALTLPLMLAGQTKNVAVIRGDEGEDSDGEASQAPGGASPDDSPASEG